MMERVDGIIHLDSSLSRSEGITLRLCVVSMLIGR